MKTGHSCGGRHSHFRRRVCGASWIRIDALAGNEDWHVIADRQRLRQCSSISSRHREVVPWRVPLVVRPTFPNRSILSSSPSPPSPQCRCLAEKTDPEIFRHICARQQQLVDCWRRPDHVFVEEHAQFDLLPDFQPNGTFMVPSRSILRPGSMVIGIPFAFFVAVNLDAKLAGRSRAQW